MGPFWVEFPEPGLEPLTDDLEFGIILSVSIIAAPSKGICKVHYSTLGHFIHCKPEKEKYFLIKFWIFLTLYLTCCEPEKKEENHYGLIL